MSVIAKAKGMTLNGPKPPNILLFSPGREKIEVSLVMQMLENCLASDRYILYPINLNGFYNDPWLENTELLILWASNKFSADSKSQNQIQTKVRQYLACGGKVLNFCPNFASSDISLNYIKVPNPDKVQTKGQLSFDLSQIGWSGCSIVLPQVSDHKIILSFDLNGSNHGVIMLKESEITCAVRSCFCNI